MASGVAFVPAERQLRGTIAPMNVRENLTITDVGRFVKAMRLSRKSELAGDQGLGRAVECEDVIDGVPDRLAQRRQPAEGDVRQGAAPLAEDAAARRTHARRRHRRQRPDPLTRRGQRRRGRRNARRVDRYRRARPALRSCDRARRRPCRRQARGATSPRNESSTRNCRPRGGFDDQAARARQVQRPVPVELFIVVFTALERSHVPEHDVSESDPDRENVDPSACSRSRSLITGVTHGNVRLVDGVNTIDEERPEVERAVLVEPVAT